MFDISWNLFGFLISLIQLPQIIANMIQTRSSCSNISMITAARFRALISLIFSVAHHGVVHSFIAYCSDERQQSNLH